MCHVHYTLLRSWALAWLLKAAQMWLDHPGEGCRTSGPHQGTAKAPREKVHNCAALQGRPPAPQLARQRRREDVFRKEELEKPEGEREEDRQFFLPAGPGKLPICSNRL